MMINREKSKVSFINSQDSRYMNLFLKDNNSNTLCLTDPSNKINIMQIVPQNFTISTNNGSSKFNIDMLINSSITIRNLFQNQNNIDLDNPLILPINDEKNVLGKFEQLYQGKIVFFTEDELQYAQEITYLLSIEDCPNYLKQKQLRSSETSFYDINLPDNDDLDTGVVINRNAFYNFLQQKIPINFLIKTNKNEYNCNDIGVYSSCVLSKILSKNSDLKEYVYNYDDEFGEFQLICDFFNFKNVLLNASNIDSLKQIATDLQINVILDKINDYFKSYEKVTQNIDDQQNLITSIDNLFELLYQINYHSFEFVKDSILNSFWSETKENVKELAAFILQVVNNDMNLHPYLVDLLIQLDEEANETNGLEVLVPFVLKKMSNILKLNDIKCSFIYNLHKKGLISKDELIGIVNNIFKQIKRNKTNTSYHNYEFAYYFNEETTVSSLCAWFLPELIEADLFDTCKKKLTDACHLYIKRFVPDKIDEYIKMRDSGMPDDELTRFIRIDDVESFQAIVAQNQINIIQATIPYNMFEKKISPKMSFLNYSALYGSIKCFKYLLLNHSAITHMTLKYAVSGGNIEIIRIVDQNLKNNEISSPTKNMEEKIIVSSIVKHRNDLFDWFFENEIINNNNFTNLVKKISEFSAKNGNAHAMIEIIDKGYSIDHLNIIKIAWKKGFYRLSLLVLNIMNNGAETVHFDFRFSVYFGNLAIVKLCNEIDKSHHEILNSLLLAIEKDYIDIVKYIFENLITDELKLDEKNQYKFFENSIINCCNDIFYYLLDQYNQYKMTIFKDFKWSNLIVNKQIFQDGDDEVIKTIINLVIDENSNQDTIESAQVDFTDPFISSIIANKKEIYKYIIEKNLYINYEKIASFSGISLLNIELFKLIYNNSPSDIKNAFLNVLLYPAITNNNKELVDFLLSEKAPHEFALLKAVKCGLFEIIKVILKHDSSPSFINKNTIHGTALTISVDLEYLSIMQLLLSVPGINPNLCNSNKLTPLLIAFDKFNVKAISALLDFYGDDVSITQKAQLNNMMIKICNLLVSTQIETRIFPILERIKQIKSLDLNYYCEEFDLLPISCQKKDKTLFEFLITIENININFCDTKTGKSPLMISIEQNNDMITKTLLNHPQINLNIRSFKGETALTIACDTNKTNIIELLIKDERFDPNANRLDFCFYRSNGKISDLLYSVKSLDVNYKIYDNLCIQSDGFDMYQNIEGIYETTLMNAVRFEKINKVDLIIQHPSFDKNKSCIQKSVFLSISNGCFSIFKKLFNLIDNDINNYTYDSKSLFTTALKFYNADVIKEILNCESFDHKKYDLLNAFIQVSTIKNGSFEIMSLLYDFDQKHDHSIDFKKLLPNGHSFLTSLSPLVSENFYFRSDNSMPNIGKIVDFLLENGADANMIDKFNVYPLEYAITSRNDEFALALINSGKIDFSVKVGAQNSIDKKTGSMTYLHLAAKISSKIFEEILKKNVIDINATDIHGNTPLLVSVKCQNIPNILLLFERDDLDFLHRDNEGRNALEIILGSNTKNIKNKNEFQKQLIALVKKY